MRSFISDVSRAVRSIGVPSRAMLRRLGLITRSPATQVDRAVPDAAACQGPHAGQQHVNAERIGEVAVGAQVEVVLVLMAHHYRLTRLNRALTVDHLALTIVATIYLGWHDAVDDVSGLLRGATAVTLDRWNVLGRSPSR